MRKKLPRRFLATLMICLIANIATAASLIDLKNALDTKPPGDRRQKLIYDYPDGNGWICHNSFRERQIKDKLFLCKEQKKFTTIQVEAFTAYKSACRSFRESCDKYRNLALDVKPEVVLLKDPAWLIGGVTITFGLGFLLGIYIMK